MNPFNVREIDRNYLILTINKRLFTMKVENHDTTKLGNQHENLLKRELQRMWTNIKLCLTTYMYFLILQLLYVYCVYLPITKLLKILIYGCFESFPFRQDFVIFVRQITWFRWTNRHWTSGVNVHNKNSNRFVPY